MSISISVRRKNILYFKFKDGLRYNYGLRICRQDYLKLCDSNEFTVLRIREQYPDRVIEIKYKGRVIEAIKDHAEGPGLLVAARKPRTYAPVEA